MTISHCNHVYQPLKGILKSGRIPTKRSVSECVDDLSQFMDDLDLSIVDLKSRPFCPVHPFIREEIEEYDSDDDTCDDDDDDDDDGDDEDSNITKEKRMNSENRNKWFIGPVRLQPAKGDDHKYFNLKKEQKQEILVVDQLEIGSPESKEPESSSYHNNNDRNKDVDICKEDNHFVLGPKYEKDQLQCLCNSRYRSDSIGGLDENNQQKKSVRFADTIYETVYIASRLYDRRSMAKFHFSTRHHRQTNNGKSKHQKASKNLKNSTSKSEKLQSHVKPESSTRSVSSVGSSDDSNGFKLTKSQRAKQSKKDKRKMRLVRKEETYSIGNCSSDDQGYGSSIMSYLD